MSPIFNKLVSFGVLTSYIFFYTDHVFAENPLGSVGSLVNVRPTSVTVGGKTYVTTTGGNVMVDGDLYTAHTGPNGDVIYTSFADPTKQVTCTQGNCSDPGFGEAIATASAGPTTVFTTEPVPGANCQCAEGADCSKVETRKYKCSIEGSGVSGFQKIFGSIVNYIVNITMLLCVLAITGLGITWSMAGGDDVKMKSTLKKWGINIIIGFIILVFFRYILKFLAPWIFQ